MRERIAKLDCARGMAILGILLMNITAFALPKAAYLNPAYNGAPSAADAWTWAIMDGFAQVKFLTLFAILFGAGLQMLLARGNRWIASRLGWLMVFGIIHAIFFWDGDILLDYGLVGLICLGVVRQADSSRALISTGAVLYMVGVLVLVLFQVMMASQTPGRYWLPGIAEQIYEHYWLTVGGAEAWQNRLDLLEGSLIAMASQYGWQLAGAMLVGAGLMRSGWLSGTWSEAHYRKMALLLIPLGLLVNVPSIILQWQLGWEYRWCAFLLQIPRDISAPFQVLGYVALLYGCWSRLSGLRLTRWVGNVGRMALTNYLLQTLLCTLIFNQMAQFMAYGRFELLALVPVIWLVNLLVSTLWLHFFQQGPFEWMWRQLTRLTAGPHAS
ncbi:DUF418 domain-containing protein YeiB [Biostraticola tofi]|uniref:DUF418 domain-containing protein n=1 Tax=Biostraticola tofi TaxID=466109 RepID=A0A4R3Z853_9GAMM|nr:DUF418 domain-containing protein YeiB [Biostraticola tofi]TCW00240.1 uncharacterized protein EDC52_101588 [Biostraticola tofi]